MKQASEQYREEMKFPFRNRWQISMYVGLIREKFQSTAYLTPMGKISVLSPNYNDYIFKDEAILDRVATFEQNLIKADGSHIFTDKENSVSEFGNYGLISDVLSNENSVIDFSMKFSSKTSERGLKGLTMYFDEVYPTEFTISVYDKGQELFTKQYTNSTMVFQTEDVFDDEGSEMIIHITKMSQPYVRFRLRYILFGVGVQFTNENFLSSAGDLSSFMHSRSVELPTCDLSLTLDNYDDKFNFDRQGSLLNLADIGQDVVFQVQYIMEDGTIENIPSTVLELSTCEADGSSLKLKAVDFLRNENATIVFDDPSFFTGSTTLYDVGMKVKESLSNISFDVILDDSLKDIPMKFSHIETTVKQAFMMIASAGRCIMDLKDKGLFIRRVDYTHSDMTASSTNKLPYSDMNVLTPDNVIPFATFELNRQKADGSYLFPKNVTNTMFKTGYISNSISDQHGDFTDVPYVELSMSEAVSPSYFSVVFNSTTPRHIIIKTYYENELRETLEYTDINGSNFETLHDFISFDKMRIEFMEIYEPYSRVYVTYVSFDKNVYDVTKDLYLSAVPKGAILESVRNIIVYYTTSTKDSEGNFEDTKKSVTISCNIKGSDVEYDNPFITTEEVARETGEWLKSYYTTRIEYDFDYVGDPTLEVNDVIRLESDYNDNLLCDIEENEISFSNGGISGKIKARRREDELVRTQSRLATY